MNPSLLSNVDRVFSGEFKTASSPSATRDKGPVMKSQGDTKVQFLRKESVASDIKYENLHSMETITGKHSFQTELNTALIECTLSRKEFMLKKPQPIGHVELTN